MSSFNLILFDRDGILNKKPSEGHYVTSKRTLYVFEDVLDRIANLSKSFSYACVTNQQGIGKGLFSQGELERINAVIVDRIKQKGGKEMPFFVCPHLESVKCFCRKPSPGLLLQALRFFNAKQEETLFIGDSETDRSAGIAAGISFRMSSSNAETIEILSEIDR